MRGHIYLHCFITLTNGMHIHIPVMNKPPSVSLLSSINALSVGLKPSLLVTLSLHLVKYPRKVSFNHCTHVYRNKSNQHYSFQFPGSITICTSNRILATFVYGARLGFLLCMYTLGVLTFKQSNHLSKSLTNCSVPAVSKLCIL